MAQPIGIDHDKVRAMFIATGSLKEAARAFKLKEGTVRQWCKREGWESVTNSQKLIQKADDILQIKRENNHPDVTPVCNVSDVLADHIENNKKAFVTNMASGLNKASRAISDMDDLSTLENSRRIVDLATAGKTIFNLGGDDSGAKLQLNVLTLSAEAFMPQIKAINS
jgi:hypothetical protein